jgi:hypothetical protein
MLYTLPESTMFPATNITREQQPKMCREIVPKSFYKGKDL